MKLFHKHLERNKRETEEHILYIDYNIYMYSCWSCVSVYTQDTGGNICSMYEPYH